MHPCSMWVLYVWTDAFEIERLLCKESWWMLRQGCKSGQQAMSCFRVDMCVQLAAWTLGERVEAQAKVC